ncbi:MAG: tRNA (N(6)-L-threonylcarbamoyladenosine(37)-C(2))-methylthiotransferase [Thermoplasmata archaeon]
MRISVEAYGCTLNQGESRIMEELLERKGHEIVPPEEAQASLIMTCCVIESTERKMLKRIRQLREGKMRVIVGGCMASTMKEKVAEIDPDAVFVSTANFLKVLEQIGRVEESVPRVPVSEMKGKGSIDAIVPIGQGCTERCSYCITRLARGSLKSYPQELIVRIVARRIQEGCKEIRLTSQDTAAYGRDIDSSLPELLERVSSLGGEYRIRMGMANIANLLPILGETMKAFESENIYKFLHVPVQSGDDEILRRMRRRYSAEDFVKVCNVFRSNYPDSTLSTDIITGFPGETDDHFLASIELMERVRPDIINVTRFSPRKGTEAFNMEHRIQGWKSKERSRLLTKLRNEIASERNESLIGSTFTVLTTERVKRGTTVGRTDSYKPIVLEGELPLGRFFDVRVTSANEVYLIGEVE